jgi:hypothetical protein
LFLSFGRAKERKEGRGKFEMDLGVIKAFRAQFKGVKNIEFFLYRLTTIFEPHRIIFEITNFPNKMALNPKACPSPLFPTQGPGK